MRTALETFKNCESDTERSQWFEACVALMDDGLREDIHERLAPCSEEAFLEAYCEAHRARFGADFIVD